MSLFQPADCQFVARLAAMANPALAAPSSCCGWVYVSQAARATGARVKCDAANSTVIGITFSGIGLAGELPATGWPSSLMYLALSIGSLSGSIPANLPSSLLELDLPSNQLTGSIPASLPSSLQQLIVSNNFLTGVVPPAIQNLPSVTLSSLFTLLIYLQPQSDLDYNQCLQGDPAFVAKFLPHQEAGCTGAIPTPVVPSTSSSLTLITTSSSTTSTSTTTIPVTSSSVKTNTPFPSTISTTAADTEAFPSTAASNAPTSTAAATFAPQPPVALIAGVTTAAVAVLGAVIAGLILLRTRRANQRKTAISAMEMEFRSAPYVPPHASALRSENASQAIIKDAPATLAAKPLAARSSSMEKGFFQGIPATAADEKRTKEDGASVALAEADLPPVPPLRIVRAVMIAPSVEGVGSSSSGATAVVAAACFTGGAVPGRKSRKVALWSADDVAEWLVEVQYNAAVAQAIRDNGIDGAKIRTLTDETMEGTLGLASAGARDVFRALVRGLEENEVNGAPSASLPRPHVEKEHGATMSAADRARPPIPPPRISVVPGSFEGDGSSSTGSAAAGAAGSASRLGRESRAVARWTADDVAEWLQEIHYSPAVAEAVRANAIGGATLLTLTDAAMEGTLGLTSVSARNAFMSLVHGLEDAGGRGQGSASRPQAHAGDEAPPPPYQHAS
ncbi:hypothetical protein HK101_011822 [Irineochytrium annulatum]|nr:hypothetical protein HK101_011822 [Irineochytrium annulatum]